MTVVGIPLHTDRLILRSWQEQDLPAFAAMNACPHVCEFLPGPLSEEESREAFQRYRAHFDRHGYGFFPMEEKASGEFVGFTGLGYRGEDFKTHFTPAVDIGWRLVYARWGKGYASEAARAVLAYAFNDLGLNEVVSFTVPENFRSRHVMEKLGLQHDPAGDFAHPNIPAHHRLSRHVLYRGRKADLKPDN